MEYQQMMDAVELLQQNKPEESLAKLQSIEKHKITNTAFLISLHKKSGQILEILKMHDDALSAHSTELELTEKMGNRQGEALAVESIGRILMQLGEHQQAEIYILRQLKCSCELEMTGLQGQAYYSLGYIHYIRAKNVISSRRQAFVLINTAMDYLTKYLKMPSSALHQGIVLNLMGNCHFMLGDFDQSLHFHTLRMKDAEKCYDNDGLITAMVNRGTCFLQMGMLHKAILSLRSVEILAGGVNSPGIFASASNILAESFRQVGDHIQAGHYYRLFLKCAELMEDQHGIAEAVSGLVLCLRSMGDYFEALHYARRLVDMADKIGNQELNILATHHYKMILKLLGVGEGHDGIDSFNDIIDRLNSSRMNDQRYEQMNDVVSTEHSTEDEVTYGEHDRTVLYRFNPIDDVVPVLEGRTEVGWNGDMDEIIDRLCTLPRYDDQRYEDPVLENRDEGQFHWLDGLFQKLNFQQRMDDQRF